ncbi:hypothetical protein ALT1644_10005 [Alteromonas macleodii]
MPAYLSFTTLVQNSRITSHKASLSYIQLFTAIPFYFNTFKLNIGAFYECSMPLCAVFRSTCA